MRSSNGNPYQVDLYDAPGNRTQALSAYSDRWGFGAQAGYYTDLETGLILCTHRFYDPMLDRFVTRDPMGYAGGINLYGYCQNDPVNEEDEEGFAPNKGGKPTPPKGPGIPYPPFFPVKVPVRFGPPQVSGGAKLGGGPASADVNITGPGPTTIDMPGQGYWNSLDPATQKMLSKWEAAQFCHYVQDHQGNYNYPPGYPPHPKGPGPKPPGTKKK